MIEQYIFIQCECNTKAAVLPEIALMFFSFPWKIPGRSFKVLCNGSLS